MLHVYVYNTHDDFKFPVPYFIHVLVLGNVVQAVKHARTINHQIRIAKAMDSNELYSYAKELGVSHELLKKTAELGRLPVVNFAAGGLGTL